MDTSFEGLTAAIRQSVADLGYELVDVRKRGTRRRPVIQIRVDRPDAVPGRGITVEECAAVSRSLQPWLDQTQVLGPGYVLEVSSPGIERPVRWLEHWERFTGHDVNVRLPGRGRVRATIVGVLRETGEVVLRLAGGEEEITVPVEQARDATLAVDWSAIDWSATGQQK